MKSSRISRVLRLVGVLQTERCSKIDDLAELLGVSKRTVFRDIQELKKAGIPCFYDHKNCCYSIDQEFFLPAVNLNKQEALGLLLLCKARDYINSPFNNPSLRAIIKIENNLPQKIKFFCNNIIRKISFQPTAKVRSEYLYLVLIDLLIAISKRRITKIHYYMPEEQKELVTDLSPYHIRHNENGWYVIGRSSFHKKLKTFDLSCIRNLVMLDKCYCDDDEFEIEEYFGRAWSIKPEGTLNNIKLRFSPEVAFNVSATQWHRTQKVSLESDGSAIVEFRVDGLDEIFWWVLSFGDKVQVIAPRALRKRISEVACNMLKNSIEK
jgi:predicted DNA-binding transcriptional regulator YafY